MKHLLTKHNYLFIGLVLFIFNFWLSNAVHTDTYVTTITHSTDSLGYYQWLPNLFIDGSFLPSRYIHTLENGNPLSVFSFGIAILMAPFFLLGHLSALLFGYQANGYSEPYAAAVIGAASFYLSFSLVLLIRLIEKRFNNIRVALLSIFIIYLGTNLFYYSAFEMGMSHVFNFFIFVVLIYAHVNYRTTNFSRYVLLVGLISGLILVVKPYNAFGLLFLLPTSAKEWKTLWKNCLNHKLAVVGGLAILMSFIALQVSYWHSVSGKYLLFSYGNLGEGFNWENPELYNVLFSVQNGWFIYTPLILFAFAGIGMQLKRKQLESAKILAIILLAYYVFASWWAWWFGAAFGHRAFVEFYSFLTLPLAYFINSIFQQKKWIKYSVAAIVILLVYINIELSYIYQAPWDGPYWNWDQLWNRVRLIV